MIAFKAALLLALLFQAKGNPEYGWWSGFKVGSSVKIRVDLEQGGMKVVMEGTFTLLELTKDKAVIERKTKVTADGKAQPESTEKEDVSATEDKNPVKIEKEGDEEIEVAGKKLKCRWIQGTQDDAKVKFWISKDVPGGIVKAEMTPPGGGTAKITAVSWERK